MPGITTQPVTTLPVATKVEAEAGGLKSAPLDLDAIRRGEVKAAYNPEFDTWAKEIRNGTHSNPYTAAVLNHLGQKENPAPQSLKETWAWGLQKSTFKDAYVEALYAMPRENQKHLGGTVARVILQNLAAGKDGIITSQCFEYLRKHEPNLARTMEEGRPNIAKEIEHLYRKEVRASDRPSLEEVCNSLIRKGAEICHVCKTPAGSYIVRAFNRNNEKFIYLGGRDSMQKMDVIASEVQQYRGDGGFYPFTDGKNRYSFAWDGPRHTFNTRR